jgi:4-amino-4-deoxy-L-arabinose transferase-like glycosyltransferase
MKKHLKFEGFFLLFILCISLFLFLFNLGNQYLWQDEAQTALVSKTILTDGVPSGYDGKNFFSQEVGNEYGKHYIWKWHTWLSFYILADFYKLFGINTFVSRLPFALFGIGSVFMCYLLCKALWEDKKTAYAAAVLLATCIPFLLLSRQCRYYSMAAFFSLWGLYSYVKILDGRKYARIAFVLSSVFLFHTHYIYCAPLFFSVLLHALLFYRNKLLTILSLVGIVILINIPWIMWLSSIKYSTSYEFRLFNPKEYLYFQSEYLKQIYRYVFTPYLLLAVPAAAIVCKIKKQRIFSGSQKFWKMLCLLIFFAASTIVTLSIISPLPFFRYLSPVAPVFIMFVACLAVLTARIHYLMPTAIIALLIIISPMRSFLYELTHDYDGPIEGIVKYLNANGNKDDIVAITYGDMPLKFYTKMRIIGGLTGEDLSDAKKAQWIIIRKYVIREEDNRVRNYLLKNVPLENYERIPINYPDIRFENREDLSLHNFRTVTNEDKVVIFHKIK